MRALVLAFILLVPHPAMADSFAEPVSQVNVRDANGKRIGTVIGGSTSPFAAGVTIALRVTGGRGILLDLVIPDILVTEFGTGFPFKGRAGGLYFESEDCTGQPFINGYPTTSHIAFVGRPGMTIYVTERMIEPASITAKSILDANSNTCRTVTFPIDLQTVLPAFAAVDLLTIFTPPFHLKFPPER